MKKHNLYLWFYCISVILIGINLIYLAYKLFHGTESNSLLLSLVLANMLVIGWKGNIANYRKKALKIKEKKTAIEYIYDILAILFIVFSIAFFILKLVIWI